MEKYSWTCDIANGPPPTHIRMNQAAASSPAQRRGATALRVVLGLAIVGALIILLGLFGAAAGVIGLIMIVAATVLSAPAGAREGWWATLAVGAALSVVAALVAVGAETLGGLLAVLAGVLVLVGAVLGFPLASDE